MTAKEKMIDCIVRRLMNSALSDVELIYRLTQKIF